MTDREQRRRRSRMRSRSERTLASGLKWRHLRASPSFCHGSRAMYVALHGNLAAQSCAMLCDAV
eukprot:9486032-Pyramimonas_sp.AAC.1